MGLIFRELELRVSTTAGLYGVRVPFERGLVVLWADNSMGKSTCLQAIIYALGLEGMLSASRDVPLPHAVTDFITTGGKELDVLESSVLLEVENTLGDVITVQRPIKTDRSRSVVTVWHGSGLSKAGVVGESREYYVREPGAAQNPSGFHRFLSNFMGLELPIVRKYDGNESPLYLEALLPLLYVEQKRGWSAIEGRYPTHYGIRDVASRSIEFLLDLDTYDLAGQKAALRREMEIVRRSWENNVHETDGILKRAGGTIENLPREPLVDWPPAISPAVRVVVGDAWLPLSQAASTARAQLARLEAEEIPRVEQVLEATQGELFETEQNLKRLESRVMAHRDSIENERIQLGRLVERVAAIEADLIRNKDALKLQSLGAFTHLSTSDGICPTCHQDIADSLISPDMGRAAMSIEQNVDYLHDQKRMFEFLIEQAEGVIEIRERQLRATVNETKEFRSRIRALKRTLISDGRLPSIAALESRIRLGEKILNYEETEQTVAQQLRAFIPLAERWSELQHEWQKLPVGNLSPEDESKLKNLEHLVREQLVEYGIMSIDPETIQISRETFKLMHEGYDLQFDLSASDTIRAAWAFRLGLLEVARTSGTNHPGFLVMDEPKQHDASLHSVRALLSRAASAETYNQQVIIATSEERESLRRILDGIKHTLVSFDGRVLKPL